MRHVRTVVLLPRNHCIKASTHHVIAPFNDGLKMTIFLQCPNKSKMLVVVLRMLS